MSAADWSRPEVEATVDDYLSMLAAELSGVQYSKADHRRSLQPILNGRSNPSIEFKHANISAALIDLGFPYIAGYKPRSNYQGLLAEVIAQRLAVNPRLLEIAGSDADRPIVPPELDDILSVLTDPPSIDRAPSRTNTMLDPAHRPVTNYIEREARNRSLGAAGEEFVLAYERRRLQRSGHERLAARIEHTSSVRGDYEGYDILSFDVSGKERLIEVKTTKYGKATPFYVTRNEVAASARHNSCYHVYRLFSFQRPGGHPNSPTCGHPKLPHLSTDSRG